MDVCRACVLNSLGVIVVSMLLFDVADVRCQSPGNADTAYDIWLGCMQGDSCSDVSCACLCGF